MPSSFFTPRHRLPLLIGEHREIAALFEDKLVCLRVLRAVFQRDVALADARIGIDVEGDGIGRDIDHITAFFGRLYHDSGFFRH